MNARKKHPTIDQWMEWLEQGESDAQLGAHLDGCGECQWIVRTMRDSRRALASGGWSEPPAEIVDTALHLREMPRPPRPTNAVPVDWHIEDVRGGGTAFAADEAQIIAGSCDAGEASLLVRPPLDDATWGFEVRAWLAEPDEEARIVVVLTHDDHVLRTEHAKDGETLRFEEIVAPGWTLEVHLRSDATLVFADPFASD